MFEDKLAQRRPEHTHIQQQQTQNKMKIIFNK
jgi:hypothetical protein